MLTKHEVKIKVMLVEDDPVWRSMLTRLINQEYDLHVVNAVATKEETIAYCMHNTPDIILMDLNLTSNNLDGIQAILAIHQMKIATKIIALTSLEREDIILSAYTAGAIHYVSKSDFRTIPNLIRTVMMHPLSPHEILLKDYLDLKEAEQYSRLTNAEKEIVSLSESGDTRQHIIEKLGKSESTLKNQITSILRKFKARTLKEVNETIKNRGVSNKELD